MKRDTSATDEVYKGIYTMNKNRGMILDDNEKTLMDYIFEGEREGKTLDEIVEFYIIKKSLK